MNQDKKHRVLNRLLVFAWFGLRFTIIISILWFFIYISGSSLLHMLHFARLSFGISSAVVDVPGPAGLEFGYQAAFLWSVVPLLIFVYWRERFFKLSTQWILPICFVIVLALFLRIIFSINDFEGLKVLLYPDFSALRKLSPIAVVGHSLVCLFVGLGCLNTPAVQNPDSDPIQLFIHSILLTLMITLLVGIMAVPMIEQVSESPFGAQWVFEIFPRWLSYGDFGSYYCFLFFFTVCFITSYLSVLLIHLLSQNVSFITRRFTTPLLRWAAYLIFGLVNAMVLMYLQKSVVGWSSQSWLFDIESLVVNGLLPTLGLLMLGIVFKHTKESERMKVFSQQQVFFHNRFFFSNWQIVTVWVVPTLIILSWLRLLY